MKVLFLLPYPIEAASTRFRVMQYIPYLEKHHVECYTSCFISTEFYRIIYQPGNLARKAFFGLKGLSRRIGDVNRLNRFDLIFVQKEALPFGTAIYEKLCASRRPLIYDFDDTIYLVNPAKSSLIPLLRSPSKVLNIITDSTWVIAGNKYLAHYALKYNKNVTVIPTSLDTEYYKPDDSKKPGQPIVIGWIGSRSTVPYLLSINHILRELAARYDFKLKVVADIPVKLDVKVDFKEWQLNDELDDLRSFDIGLMPMPDDEWTKGKCGFKIIQYMAVGKPAIASPVGVNTDIIQDGRNGFLAITPEEWRRKLTALIEKPELRQTFSEAGRKAIEDSYSLKVNAPKFLNLLIKTSGR